MPKVSTKHVQRRIAELDAQYTVPQPKRQGRFTALRGVWTALILAIIAVARILACIGRRPPTFSAHPERGSNGAQAATSSDAEAQAKSNAMWGSASTGLKRE